MSEYLQVEKPFLDQLSTLGWHTIDQGTNRIPTDPSISLRTTFRQTILPDIFRQSIHAINLTGNAKSWLTTRQLDDLRDQILRQPNRSLLEANETAHKLLLKAQVDVNELTGEADPVVQLVDYIGLASNLTEALSLYAEEDLADIRQGLKSLASELPILEERYRRLLQHFQSNGVGEIEAFVTGNSSDPRTEVAVMHSAVGAMKDVKRRADFEVYFKKFLQSLNLILPSTPGHRYRGPARRFGFLLRVIKERFKDESLDIADAGAKVKALINEHLVELGIDPKIPPVELLADDFVDRVREHSKGDPRPRRVRWSTPSASIAPCTSTRTRHSTDG